jgi:hypothetical protein
MGKRKRTAAQSFLNESSEGDSEREDLPESQSAETSEGSAIAEPSSEASENVKPDETKPAEKKVPGKFRKFQ